MKLKNMLFLTGMLLPVSSVFAQYAEDALRFSQTEQGATSRFRALGNAQTALGGDISSIASNPAGLGLFTRSELSFTPEFKNSSANANFLGSSSTGEKDKIGVNQLGIIIHKPSTRYNNQDTKKGLLSFNYGISYNKTNNFNATIDYTGNNNVSSFADYLSDGANFYLGNGDPGSNNSALPDGSLEQMAYNNYLIEYNAGGYFPTTAVNPGSNTQRNVTYHTGSQSEVNFGAAANISNQVYIGASIALASINYSVDREFTETGNTRTYPGQPVNFVNAGYDLSFRSLQETRGSGVNLKLGLLYRALPSLRFGLSFISPTWYALSDDYSEELETRYTPADGSFLAPYTNDEQDYPNDYSLTTPYRVNGGLAFIVSNFGLITGDVEYVDYSSIRFDSQDNFTDNDMKRNIRNTYQSAINYRVGAEAKVHPQVQLRAGYNIQGNPYKNSEYTANTFSTGFGYRVNNLSFDLTYTTLTRSYSPRPYVISEDYPDFDATGSGPVADIKNNINNIFATIGIRF